MTSYGDQINPAKADKTGRVRAGGDPRYNFVLPHLQVQAACTCKTAQMENPECEVHGGDDD